MIVLSNYTINSIIFSSSKSIQGLAPEASEDCDLKLCLPNKIDFVGPLNQEHIKNEIEGRLLLKYLKYLNFLV